MSLIHLRLATILEEANSPETSYYTQMHYYLVKLGVLAANYSEKNINALNEGTPFSHVSPIYILILLSSLIVHNLQNS